MNNIAFLHLHPPVTLHDGELIEQLFTKGYNSVSVIVVFIMRSERKWGNYRISLSSPHVDLQATTISPLHECDRGKNILFGAYIWNGRI